MEQDYSSIYAEKYDKDKKKWEDILKNPQNLKLYQDAYKSDKSTLSANDKRNLTTVSKMFPDLFAPAPKYRQKTIAEKTVLPSQQMGEATYGKLEQISKAGIISNPQQARIDLMEKGYLPDTRDTNWKGFLGQQFAYPLNKVFQTLTTLNRTPAAIQQEVQKKAMAQPDYKPISQFKPKNYNAGKQALKNLNPMNAINALKGIGGKGWAEVAKATFEPIYNDKSKYKNFGYIQPNTGILGGTAVAKTPMEQMQPHLDKWKTGTLIQQAYYRFIHATSPDETGNFWQRLTSGFAGTPLDIISLAEDIGLDLMSYAGGGLIKGAGTGIRLSTKGASGAVGKILKAGAEIGLRPAARKAYEAAKSARWGKLFKGIKEGSIAPSVVKGITGTDEVAKTLALKILDSYALNKYISEIPDIQSAFKAIDQGGAKLFGSTIIPGYKLEQAGKSFEKTFVGKYWQKLFNANADIPQEFRTIANYAQTSSEADKMALQNRFAITIKKHNLTEGELARIQKYFGLQADAEKQSAKLIDITGAGIDDIINPARISDIAKTEKKQLLLNKYNDGINELALTEKEMALAEDLKVYASDVYDQHIAAGGDPNIHKYDWYAPKRYKTAEETQAAYKTSLKGSIEQPFMKERTITTAQAEVLNLENKDIVTSWNQRLWEQEKDLFRIRLINGSKEYMSDIAQDGFVKVKNIPELKGKYLPQEYSDMFQRTYRSFFGEDSFNKLMKAYDKTLTLWKKLALFTPGYDGRNFITDTVSGFMHWGVEEWLSPRNWDDMRNVMQKNHVPIKLFGGQIEYADEIAEKLARTRLVDTAQSITEKGKTGVQKGFSLFDWKFNKISNPRENLGRVLGYLIERKNGANDLMATAVSKGVFFDYVHSMTQFETAVAKRFINPFWSWFKNNTRRQFELLFTRTGQYAAIPKAMNFVRNISDVNRENNEEFQQDYKTQLGMFSTPLRQPGLPDWLADILKRPRTTKAGNTLEFNPNMAFQQASTWSPKGAISTFAPALKAGLELAFNKNTFSERQIYSTAREGYVPPTEASTLLQKALEKIPEKALKTIGITKRKEDGKVLLPPILNYLLNTFAPQYALSQRGFAGTQNSAYQNISAGLGIKFTPDDIVKDKQYYTSDKLKQYDIDINTFEDSIGKDYDIPNPSQIKTVYKDLYEDYIKDKYVNVFKTKDYFASKGNNDATRALMKELMRPYDVAMSKSKGADMATLQKLLKEIGIDTDKLSLSDIEQIIKKKKEN